jgi:hypothetical protein
MANLVKLTYKEQEKIFKNLKGFLKNFKLPQVYL